MATDSEAERVLDESGYCPEKGCDLGFRVTQGGVVKHYLLPIHWEKDTSVDSRDMKSFATKAINIPADGGKIEKVELKSYQVIGVPRGCE